MAVNEAGQYYFAGCIDGFNLRAAGPQSAGQFLNIPGFTGCFNQTVPDQDTSAFNQADIIIVIAFHGQELSGVMDQENFFTVVHHGSPFILSIIRRAHKYPYEPSCHIALFVYYLIYSPSGAKVTLSAGSHHSGILMLSPPAILPFPLQTSFADWYPDCA